MSNEEISEQEKQRMREMVEDIEHQVETGEMEVYQWEEVELHLGQDFHHYFPRFVKARLHDRLQVLREHFPEAGAEIDQLYNDFCEEIRQVSINQMKQY